MMRKVVKINKPSNLDIERNKRSARVIGKILAVIVAVGLTSNMFMVPVGGKKNSSERPRYMPFSTTMDYIKQKRIDVYAETPLNELLEQLRNTKLKVIKKRLFK